MYFPEPFISLHDGLYIFYFLPVKDIGPSKNYKEAFSLLCPVNLE